MSSSASASTPENGSTDIPSARAALSVAGEVATQRSDSSRRASAGSRWATVDPVPRPTRIPSSTSSAAASAASRFSSSLGMHESRRIEVEQACDPVERHIRRGIASSELGIVRELPLKRQDCGDPMAPMLFRGGEDPDLVVHENIVSRGMTTLDVVELVRLVDVDEDCVHDLTE